jgi:uncharacterized protein
MDGPLVSLSEPPRGTPDILAWFRRGARPLVALSGGVDSASVASLAHEARGDAVAVTLVGPATSGREVERAREVARSVGISHEELAVDPLAVEGYRSNPSNRCYFCRATEARALRTWGEAHGVGRYVDGVHLDDLGDDRPGLRALREAGFEHPLVWAGWRKVVVRAFAKDRSLPNWDAPSDACLASRVRHGEPITADLLGRVERAEAFVASLGFRRVRVRTEGGDARVEVDPAEVSRLLSPEIASAARGRLLSEGFRTVVLDPLGYRPRAGS